MNERGMTMIELLVGLITAAIIATVCAQVLLVGIKTYNYSSRQANSLMRTRKALMGDGARTGLIGAARGAYGFSTVAASSVALTAASSNSNYYVSNSQLYRTNSSGTVVQTDSINGLTLNYYLTTNGIISSTTVAGSATMMTALITVTTGAVSTGQYNSYSLWSAAQLRDHP